MELEEAVLSDSDLVAQARGGDKEAFGELVRRHRARAFNWAQGVARDPHLAEDIVQDALLRAFMHLGTLADLERFLPWLHWIVRNEALMKLRRSENSGKERTFTGLLDRDRLAGATDWSDLGSVLLFMSGSGDQQNDPNDPAAWLAQKELIETMRHLLGCLTVKERAVFEAHFFRQLSPAAIARLFQTSTDSVYQSLARARGKVQEERERVRLRDYVREASLDAAGATPEQEVLSLKKGSRSGQWKRCKTSFAGALYAVLPFIGQPDYSLTEVMGLTGQAFRLTVEEERVDASGPMMYYWEPRFKEGLSNLGLDCEFEGDGGAPPTPFMLNKGIALVRRSINRGKPVMAWDLFTPEFGIIYGYDDTRQELQAEDRRAKKVIAYDQLGRGLSGGLFVLSVTGAMLSVGWKTVRRTLQMAVRHAYGELTFAGYTCGLSAYACWQDAFRRRSVDLIGNAYTVDVTADARTHAAQYIQGLERSLSQAGHPTEAAIAAQAALHYTAVAAALGELGKQFPFPSGGQPNDPENAKTAMALLERARVEEEAGILLLDRLARHMGCLI